MIKIDYDNLKIVLKVLATKRQQNKQTDRQVNLKEKSSKTNINTVT